MKTWIWLLLLAIVACQPNPDLLFRVVFPQGQGITAGDPVVMEGQPIGQVQAISFNDAGQIVLTLVVKEPHKNRLHANDTFLIAPTDQPGRKQVLVKKNLLPPGAPSPIRNQDILQGSSDPLRELADKGQQLLAQGLKDLAAVSQGFRQRLDKELNQPQWKELRQRVEGMMQQLDQAGGKTRKENAKLEDKMAELLRELEQKGFSDLATDLKRLGEKTLRKLPASPTPGR